MVRSVLVMVVILALSLGIASMAQSQAQNDSGASMPVHSKAAPAKKTRVKRKA